MARTVEAILRELVGGLVLMQAQIAAESEARADTIAEQGKTIEKLTAEVALLTEQTNARPD